MPRECLRECRAGGEREVIQGTNLVSGIDLSPCSRASPCFLALIMPVCFSARCVHVATGQCYSDWLET